MSVTHKMFNRAVVRCPASHRVPFRHRLVCASLTVQLPRKVWVLKETASTVAALKLGKQTVTMATDSHHPQPSSAFRFCCEREEFANRVSLCHLPNFSFSRRRFTSTQNSFGQSTAKSIQRYGMPLFSASASTVSCVVHQEAENRTEDGVVLKVLAHVTGMWRTRDTNIAAALGPFHIWSDRYMTRRLSWHPNMDLTLLEVRCSELKKGLPLHLGPEQKGCFSWCKLSLYHLICHSLHRCQFR